MCKIFGIGLCQDSQLMWPIGDKPTNYVNLLENNWEILNVNKKINWHDLLYWLLFDVVIDKNRKMKKKFPQTFHFNSKWLQTNPQYDLVIHICRSWCANDTDMNHPYTLAPIISHILTQLNFQKHINKYCYIYIYLTINWSIMPKITNNVTC